LPAMVLMSSLPKVMKIALYHKWLRYLQSRDT
jgi:hypothetical protein